jgi:hypothetical protein
MEDLRKTFFSMLEFRENWRSDSHFTKDIHEFLLATAIFLDVVE